MDDFDELDEIPPGTRFPDRNRDRLDSDLALLALGGVVRAVALPVRAAGWLAGAPARFHRYRRSPAPATDSLDFLAGQLDGLSEPARGHFRLLLATVLAELDGRWQWGGRLRVTSFVLAGTTSGARAWVVPARQRPPVHHDISDRNWRNDVLTTWFRHDEAHVPGHLATAFVAGNHENAPLVLDDRLMIYIRYTGHPAVLHADLRCTTRGFVLRRSTFTADYRPIVEPPPAAPHRSGDDG